jgi:hypothetical protein
MAVWDNNVRDNTHRGGKRVTDEDRRPQAEVALSGHPPRARDLSPRGPACGINVRSETQRRRPATEGRGGQVIYISFLQEKEVGHKKPVREDA